MSYTVLFGRKSIQLSSKNLVIPAAHVKSFDTAIECAEEMRKMLEQEQARVDTAAQVARQEGFAQGHLEGKQVVEAAFADVVEQMIHERHAQQEAARDAVCSLALAVVRKLAASLGAHEMVPALLEQALTSLMPDRFASVRVHPDLVEAVRARLPDLGYPIEVVGDDGLEPFGCVLDHPQGQQVVSLETQLSVIGAALDVEPASQDLEAA